MEFCITLVGFTSAFRSIKNEVKFIRFFIPLNLFFLLFLSGLVEGSFSLKVSSILLFKGKNKKNLIFNYVK
jgi:hypothetical protein